MTVNVVNLLLAFAFGVSCVAFTVHTKCYYCVPIIDLIKGDRKRFVGGTAVYLIPCKNGSSSLSKLNYAVPTRGCVLLFVRIACMSGQFFQI